MGALNNLVSTIWQMTKGRKPPQARYSKRRYAAARPDRLVGGFKIGPGKSINENLRHDLRGLIAHSRHQAENNDYLKGFLNSVRRNVIGYQGIRLQNQARDENGKLDSAANKIIEDAWKKFGKFGSPTVCGSHTWLSSQNVIARTVPRDGSIFLRHYRGRQFGEFAYQFQMLSVDHLDFDSNVAHPDGSRTVMGIEIGANEKIRAYHLFRRHPGETLSGRSQSKIRVLASDIAHVFLPEDPAQIIGVPWAHTALRRLNMLHGFEEASLTNARAGASKMGFFERTLPEDFEPDDTDNKEQTEDGHLIEEFVAGNLEELPMGMTFKEFNPGYPNGEIEPFIKAVLRGAAAGLGVSYSSLANDLSDTNFSSLRAGLGEEREEWRTIQGWLSSTCHGRVYNEWLPQAMLSGSVALPFRKLEKFSQPTWRPRGWQAVNPVQESDANQQDLGNGLRSPQDIVAERGEDLEEIYEKIAEAQRLATQHGLNFQPTPKGPILQVPNQD